MSDINNKRSILVVEDEVLLLEAIAKKLKVNNYEVVTATSDTQVIDYLESMSTPPDAIWLDYYLGDVNSLELLKKIKEKELWKDIPIVVVSNSSDKKVVQSMMALGANKYLLKAENKLQDIIKTFDNFITQEQLAS